MKNIILISAILLSFKGFGQDSTNSNQRTQSIKSNVSSKNNISVDVIRGLVNEESLYRWMIQYERVLSEHFSAVLAYEFGQYENYSKQIIAPSGSILFSEEYFVKGSMLLLEGRYYPFTKNKNAPRGFFVGTYFKNFWLKESMVSDNKEQEFNKKQNIGALGFDVGYQFFKSWFMLEPVLGFGTAWDSGIGQDKRIDSKLFSYEAANYSLRLGLNIGVCF